MKDKTTTIEGLIKEVEDDLEKCNKPNCAYNCLEDCDLKQRGLTVRKEALTEAKLLASNLERSERAIHDKEIAEKDKEIAKLTRKSVLSSSEGDLQKYKDFYEHIKSHFPQDFTKFPKCWVKCNVCNKTFDEIVRKQ